MPACVWERERERERGAVWKWENMHTISIINTHTRARAHTHTHTHSMEVGDLLKRPKVSVWVVCSESHFSGVLQCVLQ